MAIKAGEAYVEIIADFRRFERMVKEELDRLLQRVARVADTEPLEQGLAKSGRRSGRAWNREVVREVESSRSRSARRRAGRRAGEDLGSGLRAGLNVIERREDHDRNIFTRFFRGLFDTGRRGVASLGQNIKGALSSLASNVKSTLASLDPLRGGLWELIFTLVKWVTIGPGVVGAIFAIGSALYYLSGIVMILPGMFASLLAAFAPLVIAFQGFGEAISAIASGDIEKINEALKGLTPSARAVAKEFAGLMPLFRQIRDSVQEAFFRPLRGEIADMADNLLPSLRRGMERVAGALGEQFAAALDKLNSARGAQFFDKLFATTERVINELGPAFIDFLGSLGGAIEESLPFAEELFGAIADGLKAFADFIDEKVEDGSFVEFLKDSVEVAKELSGLIKDILGLFVAIFSETDEGTKEFLRELREVIKEWTAFLKSPEGKEGVKAILDMAKQLATWMRVIGGIIGFWVTLLGKAKRKMEELQQEAPGVARALRVAMGGLSPFRWFASGGIVTRPTLGVVGEAGPEVVVPLNNPRRARELMEESGLMSLAANMRGGGDVHVTVFLGTQQITDILDQRVERKLATQGRLLSRGVREE